MGRRIHKDDAAGRIQNRITLTSAGNCGAALSPFLCKGWSGVPYANRDKKGSTDAPFFNISILPPRYRQVFPSVRNPRKQKWLFDLSP